MGTKEDKMNSYEVCKLLGLSPKGLNRLDLKIELRERRCRGENIIYHRFEREAIERAKTSKELAELKHNPKNCMHKGVLKYFAKNYTFLLPYSEIELTRGPGIYCPVCREYVIMPPHFRNKLDIYYDKDFTEERFLWLCSMITHVRHFHTNYDSSYPENNEENDFSFDIIKNRDDYNTYAKKKIITEMSSFLRDKQIGKDIFLKLNNNDEGIINLINETLS